MIQKNVNNKVIVGHQPQYFPYLGIFNKIIQSDIFLFVDSTKFVSKVWHNRTIIKDKKDKIFYLTIPVTFNNGQIIKDIKLADNKWKIKHLKSIKNIYGSSKYFNDLYPLIENVILQNSNYLIDYSLMSMSLILDKISFIKENIFIQSSEKIIGNKNELIVNITRNFNSNCYLSGEGAKNYVDEKFLISNGISHQFNKFEHPKYNQLGKIFTKNLSVIDCIFNIGFDEFKKIIK
ncbi:WbqC family protein [Candidatus Pelagibacter bacterium]|nr:WbqC family protein [Candidatus Pelagibacter bacterium]MDA8836402.1 WbqC family protein [Candidatus Pelagibacter bacterium]